MAIKIKVRLLGVFQSLSGKKTVLMELEEPSTVRKVVDKLVEVSSHQFKLALIDVELNDPRPNSLILVNGKEITVLNGLETQVKHGDELVLIPVRHGGWPVS
ncbi:MAG: MoaD/ThiS family protein [Thermoproteota archaeon]|nr:MoaD/ThiS family protein [Thermoproteota archaeon]